MLGEAAPNWCLHRRPLFSPWTFYYSGRKDGKNIKTKTQCWHSSAALWTEGEMSKQSPGAGVFWWTKLPARRLHVGQVNKAQRRWCGGFDRVRLWNLWLCFHRLAAMLICKWNGRYSHLDNFCPATPSLIFLHKRSCVIQSKHHILSEPGMSHPIDPKKAKVHPSLLPLLPYLQPAKFTLCKSVLTHISSITYCLLLAPPSGGSNKTPFLAGKSCSSYFSHSFISPLPNTMTVEIVRGKINLFWSSL